MLTFLGNLWRIGTRLPAILSILREIMDIVGSVQVQAILQSIKNILTNEVEQEKAVPTTEAGRKRLLDRFRRRQALAWLGMTEPEFDSLCQEERRSNNHSDSNNHWV